MSVKRCFGNYMDCSQYIHYSRCKALKPRNGKELREICIRCEKCVFSNSCSLLTLTELVV